MMKSFYRPTVAKINLQSARHNLQLAQSCAGQAKVLTVIKADAYGHGLITIAQALQTDASQFGVASIDDVLALRDAGIQQPIVCLSGFYHIDEARLFAQHNAIAVIYDVSQLHALQCYAEQEPSSEPLKIWLKVDTGMGRLGFHATQIVDVLKTVQSLSQIECLGVLTHFSDSDDPDSPKNQQQIAQFATIKSMVSSDFPDLQFSLSNSAAVVSRPEQAHDMIRPGIMLYGASPIRTQTAAEIGLRPVMTLESQLISIKQIDQHTSVGYGSTWQAPSDMRIGVVAIGYGDGYPRHAPTGTPVLINGKLSRLLGRVSMDLISVDLSAIDAKVGDKVVLWGEGLPVERVAACADTISYELLCGVTKRVPRVFVDAES